MLQQVQNKIESTWKSRIQSFYKNITDFTDFKNLFVVENFVYLSLSTKKIYI